MLLFYRTFLKYLTLSYWILPFVDSIPIDGQHGFRHGPSTTLWNLTFCKYILKSFRVESQVVIYTNFAKAMIPLMIPIMISLITNLLFLYLDPLNLVILYYLGYISICPIDHNESNS